MSGKTSSASGKTMDLAISAFSLLVLRREYIAHQVSSPGSLLGQAASTVLAVLDILTAQA
jgi:hypothetical protein